VSTSPLERAILGLLASLGSATPYGIRKVFEQSPSSHWSGSSGAIYPAVRRLEKAGLLATASKSNDGRGTVACTLTPQGRQELEAWLTSPVEATEAAYSFDPIRLRILFMHTLPIEEQRDLVERALAGLTKVRDAEDALHAELLATGATGGTARATRGSVMVLEARIAWLTDVLSELEATEPVRPSPAPTENH
jgi:DNA-binding PadR family transcriptional regulator